MSRFIKWLEKLNEGDSKVRAVLKRSLAFDPGQYVPAYPYVEPFVRDEGNTWRREMLYLTAGIWAMQRRELKVPSSVSIGTACATYQIKSGSSSIERRFVSLLDADGDQLPHRLRQMIALLKEQPIDFETLLEGLLKWNYDRKPTQLAWARDFYRALSKDTKKEEIIEEENV